ncbi:MAG TPA: hypothetical protein VM030_06535 [Acidimicrobiales bacterium]|nr:hypothetical protein [Acidimicrobiales bacterium]
MTRIAVPLYDPGAAVACSLDDADVPARMATIERLRHAAASIDRTEHGLVLRFGPGGGVDDEVARFARDEKRCCGFFGFAVDREGDDLVLRWDVPPTAGPVLDRLVAYFSGTGDIEDLRGLL